MKASIKRFAILLALCILSTSLYFCLKYIPHSHVWYVASVLLLPSCSRADHRIGIQAAVKALPAGLCGLVIMYHGINARQLGPEREHRNNITHKRFIGLGLLFGALGDVILRVSYLPYGLASFLLGHLCYIRAFTIDEPLFQKQTWKAMSIIYVCM